MLRPTPGELRKPASSLEFGALPVDPPSGPALDRHPGLATLNLALKVWRSEADHDGDRVSPLGLDRRAGDNLLVAALALRSPSVPSLHRARVRTLRCRQLRGRPPMRRARQVNPIRGSQCPTSCTQPHWPTSATASRTGGGRPGARARAITHRLNRDPIGTLREPGQEG